LRIALLSDIHSNLEALDAVLDALPEVEDVVVLGDIVGYGPDPNAVIDRLREIKARPVLGNHDQVMLDPAMLDWFNPHAASAARWTREVLTPASRGLDASEPRILVGSSQAPANRAAPVRPWQPAQALPLGVHPR